MDIEELMRPFDGSQVRQRMGPGRKPLDYISGPDVIRRLLDATGNRFSWNVERVQLVNHETASGSVGMWIVQGTLSLGDLGYRSGVGTHPADSVEAAKAAETDALKRAAIKFGVGLHLYEDDSGAAAAQAQQQQPQRAEQQRPAASQASQAQVTRAATTLPRTAANGSGYAATTTGARPNGSFGNGGNNRNGGNGTNGTNGVGEDAPF